MVVTFACIVICAKHWSKCAPVMRSSVDVSSLQALFSLLITSCRHYNAPCYDGQLSTSFCIMWGTYSQARNHLTVVHLGKYGNNRPQKTSWLNLLQYSTGYFRASKFKYLKGSEEKYILRHIQKLSFWIKKKPLLLQWEAWQVSKMQKTKHR